MLNLRLLTRLWPSRAVSHAPPASGRSSARRRAGTALATGTAVVVLVQLGLALAAEKSFAVRDPVYADRAKKLSAIEQALPTGSPVVVMLGTSRTGNGFDAGRASSRLAVGLGRPAAAFNFGVSASGPILHNTYLKRLLDEGHRPSLLLLEVLPVSFAELGDGPLESKFFTGARFRHSELDALAGYGIPAESLTREWRATVVAPAHALRLPIVGRVAPWTLPVHKRMDESRSCDPHGWQRVWEESLPPNAKELGRARAHKEYAELLRTLEPSDRTGQALRDTLALAHAHNIPTRLVLMPESDEFRSWYSPVALARFNRWIANLAAKTGTRLVDTRQWVPYAGFVDGHHLLPGGAATFSVRLTDEVLVPALAEAKP